MSGKYDPRAPRPNPEFRDIWRTIKRRMVEMKSAEKYTEIRGHCAILQALIEQLLDEPEFIVDMEPGPSPAGASIIFPENETGDPIVGENPFDRPGPAENQYFYLTYSKQMTGLFPGGQDPYNVFNLGVYWVLLFEKAYASHQETSMHFTSQEAVDRMFPRRRKFHREDSGKFVVFMDPQGDYYGAAARTLGVYQNRNRAVKRADELSGRMGIRCLVARLAGWIDTH